MSLLIEAEGVDKVPSRSCRIATIMQFDQAEVLVGPCLADEVTSAPPEDQRLLVAKGCIPNISLGFRKGASTVESAGQQHRRDFRAICQRKHHTQTLTALGEVPTNPPELPKRASKPHGLDLICALNEGVQRSP